MVDHPGAYGWSSHRNNAQGEADRIRTATNGNYALGNDRFAAQLASALSRRVTPGKAGRPPKHPEAPASRDLFEPE